jgi:FAD/FMN-containing dehydrogenase
VATKSKTLSFDALKSGLAGRIIVPGDADYDAARQVMYGGVDKKPAVIVRTRDAADVRQAVAFARDNGLELAVRSGGHSAAGHSTTEGGLVVDLREMQTIEIDAAAKTAWAEAGATALEMTEAATDQGLVVGFGDAGSVGLGGITTGGGVGYLSRKHGLTIDSLLAAEVVTADGRIVTTDAKTEPDLFWAIRGGGGNFGVVTRFKFKLQPLPEFTGGMMCLLATAETIAGFAAACEAAPEALSAIGNVTPAPPMPSLPAEQHGKLVILAMIGFAGPSADAEEALKPFRAIARPLADLVKAGPYLSMYPPEDPDYHPMAVSLNLFVDHIGKSEGETVVKHLNESDASLRVCQIRVLGGAINRVPADATAYAHRSSKIMINVAAFYDGVADKPKKQTWVAAFAKALRQADQGAYVNFVGDEGEARVRNAYPGATWDRLRTIKKHYDPHNLFRLNQNIPPAAELEVGTETIPPPALIPAKAGIHSSAQHER